MAIIDADGGYLLDTQNRILLEKYIESYRNSIRIPQNNVCFLALFFFWFVSCALGTPSLAEHSAYTHLHGAY